MARFVTIDHDNYIGVFFADFAIFEVHGVPGMRRISSILSTITRNSARPTNERSAGFFFVLRGAKNHVGFREPIDDDSDTTVR
jgi:hypothetical protein